MTGGEGWSMGDSQQGDSGEGPGPLAYIMACGTERKAMFIGQSKASTPAKSGNPKKQCSSPASFPTTRFQGGSISAKISTHTLGSTNAFGVWNGCYGDKPAFAHVCKCKTAKALFLEDLWSEY